MSSKDFPSQADPAAIAALSRSVKPGEYCLYPSSDIPAGIPSAGPNCQAVLIAASVMHSSDVPGLPESAAPYGTVFLWGRKGGRG